MTGSGDRGFALIITLIVTALLVGLVTEFVKMVYVDANHSHNFTCAQQAGMLSESGALLGRSLLEAEFSSLPGVGHPDYSSLNDRWAQPLHWDDERGTLDLAITEESGKLNLNNVLVAGSDPKNPHPFRLVTRNLLKRLKLDPELCDPLVDWASNDQAPLPNGAKTRYYQTLNPPYNAKGARLGTLEELGLIKGFSAEVVETLRPHVTVYSSLNNEPVTMVNINTASGEVLEALGILAPAAVAELLKSRKEKPMKTLSDIPGLQSASPGLLGMIAFRGRVFRIRSEGRSGGCATITETVVRMTDSGSQTLYWREY